MSRAIIVLGHGSRSLEATADFMKIVDMLRERQTGDLVLPAFMELADPSLEETMKEATENGAEDILVLPCFLFQGNHIKRDIPEMLAEMRRRYPNIRIKLRGPLGPDPRVVDILVDRLEEACCQS